MVENELGCQLVVEIDPKGKLLAAAVGTYRQTREPRQVGGQGVTVGRADPAVRNPGDAVGAYSHIGLQKAVPYTVLDARSGRVVMRLPSGPELGARCGFCRKGPSQHQNGDGLAHRTDAAIALHGEARSKNRHSIRSGSSKWRRPRNAVACLPHWRIAPVSATPVGQNSRRSLRSVPEIIPSGPKALRVVPSIVGSARSSSSSAKS